ncbi:hypothetical protein EEL32_16840 [Brevibacillus laterosporus]|nr:hypothetical protein [Brevibacillus laterosporus]TPG84183.1 hypothetical protein EEL32_16840 [Brevibacillus laterosporus]
MNKFGDISICVQSSARACVTQDETHGFTTIKLTDNEALGALHWRFRFVTNDGREIVVGDQGSDSEWIRSAEIEIIGDDVAYDLVCALRAISNTLEHRYRKNNWTVDVSEIEE